MENPMGRALKPREADRLPARCRPEEFEITNQGITHKPTGYAIIAQTVGEPTFATEKTGQLGSLLKDGRDYTPREVRKLAHELWHRRIAAR
jgi:hypothetical protein